MSITKEEILKVMTFPTQKGLDLILDRLVANKYSSIEDKIEDIHALNRQQRLLEEIIKSFKF